uniref:Uncharacterized protein n=1 Tax=Timema douglasi TaxID=61478 RepID=A0A7R8Z493_TIMDO|nr:unnamed protein product [Timema douglasi]
MIPTSNDTTLYVISGVCFRLAMSLFLLLYIKSVDGFIGIYRGLAPKLCSNVISGFTFHKVSDALRRNTDDKSEQYAEDEELSEEQR